VGLTAPGIPPLASPAPAEVAEVPLEVLLVMVVGVVIIMVVVDEEDEEALVAEVEEPAIPPEEVMLNC
jgi:hypothetical protein